LRRVYLVAKQKEFSVQGKLFITLQSNSYTELTDGVKQKFNTTLAVMKILWNQGLVRNDLDVSELIDEDTLTIEFEENL